MFTSRSECALNFWNFCTLSSTELVTSLSRLPLQTGILDPPSGVERPDLRSSRLEAVSRLPLRDKLSTDFPIPVIGFRGMNRLGVCRGRLET